MYTSEKRFVGAELADVTKLKEGTPLTVLKEYGNTMLVKAEGIYGLDDDFVVKTIDAVTLLPENLAYRLGKGPFIHNNRFTVNACDITDEPDAPDTFAQTSPIVEDELLLSTAIEFNSKLINADDRFILYQIAKLHKDLSEEEDVIVYGGDIEVSYGDGTVKVLTPAIAEELFSEFSFSQ